MKNQYTKKIYVLVLTGVIFCTLGIGNFQVISAKQTSSNPKIKIGQKFVVPGLKLKQNTYVLDYKEADVTGDSVPDEVILGGTKEKIAGKLDAYASNLSVIVQNGKTKKHVKYDWLFKGTDGKWHGEMGRKPNLIINEHTSDNVRDIIVVAPQGGSGGHVDRLGLTWKNNRLQAVFVDKPEVYTHFPANFSFKPPVSWIGHYRASEYGAGYEGHINKLSRAVKKAIKHAVDFDYKMAGGGTKPLLTISVFAKDDWKHLPKEEAIQAGDNVIKEANGMVYVQWMFGRDIFDPSDVDGQRYPQLYDDLHMAKSFALLKK